MAFTDVLNKAQQLAGENSASILTGVGVTGVVTTAYLTGKASWKAANVYQKRNIDGAYDYTMTHRGLYTEVAKDTWKLYIPAVAVGSATVGSILYAHRLSSKKAAALTAAYGISERAFAEYKEKVVEKIGEKKEQEVRSEIHQDRVNAQPFNDKLVVVGTGEVPVLDAYSGRYFSSSVQTLKAAANKINHEILTLTSCASLSEFYDLIGLPANSNSNEVGFNLNNIIDLVLTTTLTEDDTPCVVMDFRSAPSMFYGNLHS